MLEALGPLLTARPDAIRWQDGAVYCFQYTTVEHAHCQPPDARHTFAGYAPTGKPTWIDFVELCLQLRPAGLDRLFGTPPGVISLVQTADVLNEELLPGFGRGQVGYSVLGQVIVGLLPADLGRSDERATLTVQLVETRFRGSSDRLRINLLGIDRMVVIDAASAGAPRNPAEQLRRTLASTRRRLDTIARRLDEADARREPLRPGPLIEPLLRRLRSDLNRIFSPDHRRTRHASERHGGAHRPTSAAWDDLAGASDERVLRDTRRGTIVVLGRRQRAHVFSPEGRHVTSLRLEAGELTRKTSRKRWVPLAADEISAFRAAADRARTDGRPSSDERSEAP